MAAVTRGAASAVSAAMLAGGIAGLSTARAQIELGGLGQTDRAAEAKKQHVELLTDSVSVTASKPQEVELRFRVDPGFHINSHTPKDQLLIPTVLNFEQGKARISDEAYPAGRNFHLPVGNGEDLDVYQGEFRVRLRVVVPAGTSDLRGSLRYQACDTAACFPPRTLPVKIALTAR